MPPSPLVRTKIQINMEKIPFIAWHGVRPSFIFRTQIMIFLMNLRAFWPSIDSNAITTWHQWFNHNFMKLRELFLCAKNTKITKITLYNKITVFLLKKKYYHSFIKLRLSHWCHMDYFIDVLTTFLGLECVSCVAVYGGSESSRISLKIPYFVFWRWTMVLHEGE